MAVFLINICKFNGCGITFPSLGDLIQHIEDTHIDYDPKVVEQKEQSQPASLPLSYVLRFITDATRTKDAPYIATPGMEIKRKLAIKHHSYSMSSSNRSNTPTGSEMDEDEMLVSESEDSNDSWTTEEFSSEFIMRYGSRHSGPINGTQGHEKPFACPVPGCKKRYKNVNGIKYHSKNGHKKDGKVRKGYKCHCGKSYKTAQGLKTHALVNHNSSSSSSIIDNMVNNISIRSSSPSQQSNGSLSPSSISNMSNSNSSGGNTISSSNTPNQQNGIQSSFIAGSSHHHNQQQSQQHHTQSSNNNNVIQRNNIGLISIKTTSAGKPSQAQISNSSMLTQNKVLKLTSPTNSNLSSNGQNSLDNIIVDNVNLGILTPATSPNKQQMFHTTSNGTNCSTTNYNCGNNNNQHYDNSNLPMTPISPNIQTKSITSAVSSNVNNSYNHHHNHQHNHHHNSNSSSNNSNNNHHSHHHSSNNTSLAIGSIITNTGSNTTNNFEMNTSTISAQCGGSIDLLSNDET